MILSVWQDLLPLTHRKDSRATQTCAIMTTLQLAPDLQISNGQLIANKIGSQGEVLVNNATYGF